MFCNLKLYLIWLRGTCSTETLILVSMSHLRQINVKGLSALKLVGTQL